MSKQQQQQRSTRRMSMREVVLEEKAAQQAASSSASALNKSGRSDASGHAHSTDVSVVSTRFYWNLVC